MGQKVKIQMNHQQIEMDDTYVMDGTMYNSATPFAQHVLFTPENPTAKEELKYKCSGELRSYKDGTVEFVRRVRKRSCAEQLARTEYGTLSKTADGYLLVQIRIPADGKHDYASIIRNDAYEIAESVI